MTIFLSIHNVRNVQKVSNAQVVLELYSLSLDIGATAILPLKETYKIIFLTLAMLVLQKE
jgi:hypothetical protein